MNAPLKAVPTPGSLEATMLELGRKSRAAAHTLALAAPARKNRALAAMAKAIRGSCAAILEAVRDSDWDARVFVATSGGMFGEAPESPQRENTPCRPTTPYGIAKLATHQLVGLLRARDGLYACSGITFNHESERRPEQFVTRRISRAAAAISLGLQQELTLGSLDVVRDWTFADDVMEGIISDMKKASDALDFELAAKLRNQMQAIEQT